ncbi:MAG: trypsin-like serine protease [Oscillatoria sp. SIO1A7]|nr:trypsin-like serine protease [Oscillatoria sp. SIO1A7]
MKPQENQPLLPSQSQGYSNSIDYYDWGYETGLKEGEEQGYINGRKEGRDKGYSEGIKAGRIKGFIGGVLASAAAVVLIFTTQTILKSLTAKQPDNKAVEATNAMSNSSENESDPRQALSSDPLEKEAQLVTVKVFDGDSWGSGILISKQDKFYTVLTNGHVLSEAQTYHILTFDDKIYEAQLLFRFDRGELGDDLALLQFSSNDSYEVAKLNRSELKPPDTVYAAGFPFSREWLFDSGSVELILEEPLKNGYQVAYSIDIEKGMSGGPLFNDKREVVGVNGKHSHPLWDAPYLDKDGIEIQGDRKELDEYSWAIPIETFLLLAPDVLLAEMVLNPPLKLEQVDQTEFAEASEGGITVKITPPQGGFFAKPSLEIIRYNKTVLKEELPTEAQEKIRNLQVRDLDGDGELEVIVNIRGGKKSQYSYSLIYRYVSEEKTYNDLKHPWGFVDGKPSYRVVDLDEDGIPELESYNRKLSQFADQSRYSASPLQIWHYSQGEIKDVTREYPDRIRSHLIRLWRGYQVRRSRGWEDKRVLAAYLAEKHLLGEEDEGWQRVEEAYYGKPDRDSYLEELDGFLRRMGY